MAITERQRLQRQRSIGGSDIATLLGHNNRTQYDLWLEKKHGVTTFDGNDATEFGDVVEAGIADWAAGKLGVKIRKNVYRRVKGMPFHANLDALVMDAPEAVEVKTSSYRVEEDWGEPNTDEVPHKVICQCQLQMHVAELDAVHVAAGLMPAFGSQRLRLYKVNRHDDLIDTLTTVGERWWNKYIIGDHVPADLPSTEAIKRIQRAPNLTREIDRELLAELIQAKADARDANALVKDLTKALHASLYDPDRNEFAEAGTVNGEPLVTYYEYHRKAETKPRGAGVYRRLMLPKSL